MPEERSVIWQGSDKIRRIGHDFQGQLEQYPNIIFSRMNILDIDIGRDRLRILRGIHVEFIMSRGGLNEKCLVNDSSWFYYRYG